MIRMLKICAGLAAVVLLFAATTMRSEGFLFVGGPTDAQGVPYNWSINSLAFTSATNTLNYWTDQGALGSQTNTQANNLVAGALGEWSAVTTANINFNPKGQLNGDVTGVNAKSFFNNLEDCSTLPGLPAAGTPQAQPVSIIYDTDGSVITALGGDSTTTLGLATALCPTSNGTTLNTYNRGEAILNGKFSTDTSQLTTVMIHELGHMLGLDHTQINLDCLNNTNACVSDGSIAGVPIMFPVLIDNKQAPVVDDIAGISKLYPATTTTGGKTLFSSMGEIHGRVFFSDGVTQAQAFNVIARNVLNPRVTASSNLSGFLFTDEVANGAIPSSSGFADPFFSRDQTLIGYFDIPGLPPGTYTVEVEAVNNSGQFPFVAGSSIGPIGSIAQFQFAMPGTCTQTQYYFNPPVSNPCLNINPTQVSVGPASGGAVTVNISLEGTGPRFDGWED